ncbi:hypothetical protein LCGC14_1994920 [marine sediment metagenome]|uniref:Uncharacterized protein n=1 Tax=marine sediment metagenome TaxID=412755 RepID=A0A0F9F4S8_9ZZZZ
MEDSAGYNIETRSFDRIECSDLPTLPIPEGIEGWPIWALDYAGNCLVGDGADEIQPLSEIVAYYEGAAIRERGFYLICKNYEDASETLEKETEYEG